VIPSPLLRTTRVGHVALHGGINESHNSVLSLERMDAPDKLIALQFLPITRSLSRLQRAVSGKPRYTQLKYTKIRLENHGASQAQPAIDSHEELAAPPRASTSGSEARIAGRYPRGWRFGDPGPFAEGAAFMTTDACRTNPSPGGAIAAETLRASARVAIPTWTS
jgi:hypothetical protein